MSAPRAEKTAEDKPEAGKDFIREIVDEDLRSGKHKSVVTRFPPEPNGYPHIGHAKAIWVNFGVAKDFGGVCNLRFDDTNPTGESVEYEEALKEGVRWLGYEWEDRLFHASGYFERLYEFAEELIGKGKAYVCDMTPEDIRRTKGTATEPGEPSPHRDRPAQESLDLFRRMRAGEFKDGTYTVRAKIDMAHPNFHMRDPVIYRIMRLPHYRAGDKWVIYPMYDFTHGLSDALEGVTHSLCSLEFREHRPLYDWFIENLDVPSRPRQIEFASLNLGYTLLSKRYLKRLVQEGRVSGWDDPRMPTLRGLRRRGYTPEAVREFLKRAGLTTFESRSDMALLENCVRADLNERCPRAMAVLDPLRVVIENYPKGGTEEVDAVNNPQDPTQGTRKVPFSRTLYIERGDFMEDPPKKFFRLAPGREVRLRYAYIVKCVDVRKDPSTGEIVELRCVYDPDTRTGGPAAGRKVKGIIHWVSAEHSVEAEVRLYDRLFNRENMSQLEEGKEFIDYLNPDSLKTLKGSRVEPGLGGAAAGARYQFERVGYFCADPDTKPGKPVFNRTVALRDAWAKLQKKKP